MIHDKKFYDTSALLEYFNHSNELDEKIYISSITLKQIAEIENDILKDEIDYGNNIEVIFYKDIMSIALCDKGIHASENDDELKILATAISANEHDDIIFVTENIYLRHVANLFFGDEMIQRVVEK